MARDKVIAAVIEKFGKRVRWSERPCRAPGHRSPSRWLPNASEAARTVDDRAPITDEEKHTLRQELWPIVRELAEAPDLLQRAVTDVHALGVVNEEPLIKAVLLTAVSRHLLTPLQLLVKGPSSSGKSFVTDQTLKLFHPSGVKHLTTTSPLSLVYDEEPLSHKLIAVFEATQIQSDPNSIFALLLRSLMSTGKLVHETTVEDPEAQYGRRTERIEREGPIATIITTTGEIHAENDTRMTTYFATSSEEQTQAVLQGVAARAAGKAPADPDLSRWHALDQWLSYGPHDAVVPFAESIVARIEPLPRSLSPRHRRPVHHGQGLRPVAPGAAAVR